MVLGGTARGIGQGESIVTLKIDSLLATRKARTGNLGIRFAIALLAVLAFSLSVRAQASDIYITPDGSPQGACTSNVQTPAFFNNSANWGTAASKIGPGTTVHLCGTFNGSAGQQLLTFQQGGASGNVVTLLFESGATLTAPYWGSSGSAAINTAGKSNLVIDGGTNGTVQNTDNGTGLKYQQASIAVIVVGGSNVTVKKLTVSNICRHTSSGDNVACNSGGNNDRAILVTGVATNVSITLNTIHDSQNCVEYSGSGSDTGVSISKNTIYHCNWGIGGYGSTNGLLIFGNDISSATNWDTGADSFHHNGIMLFPQSGNMNNVVISSNYVHDINGTETGHIFLDPGGSGNIPGVLVYNNVLTTTVLNGPTNNFIEPGANVTSARIFNNTMVGAAQTAVGVWNDGIMENNVVVGSNEGIGLSVGVSGIISDYNDSFGLTGGSPFNYGTTFFSTMVAWTTGTSGACAGGCDQHSLTTNPKLASDYTLGSGSPAIGAGKNLSSLGISGLDIGAPQSFGASYACGTGCVARSQSGNWDIGAYPIPNTSSQPQTPTAPSSLSAIVQ
jgi:hypothetical protein